MSTTSNISMVPEDSNIFLKHHVNFAKKLHNEMLNLEKVNWAEIFNSEAALDVVSSVANQFVQDVNKLIYNLHEIMIKINKNESSYNDLKVLVNKLSKTSANLQDTFGQEYSVLKSNLVIEIQNIVKEAQSLTSIVEKDELHECKIQLVDSLSEILSDLQKVLIYNDLKQLTSEELAQVLNECEQDARDVVADNHVKHETSVDKTILERVARHTYHGVIGAQRVVFQLHNVAIGYNDAIKESMNRAAKSLNKVCMDVTVGIYQMNRCGEGTFPLDKCMIEGFQAFREIMGIMNALNHCDKNGKDWESLKNLVLLLLASSLCFTRRFIRDMGMDL